MTVIKIIVITKLVNTACENDVSDDNDEYYSNFDYEMR